MKPQQATSTVFAEIDDEDLYEVKGLMCLWRFRRNNIIIHTPTKLYSINLTITFNINNHHPSSTLTALISNPIITHQTMDWKAFEDMFKLGGGLIDEADGTPKGEKKSRKSELVSLLEPNRLRNVGRFAGVCTGWWEK